MMVAICLKFVFLIIFFLTIPCSIFGQDTDFQLWTRADVSKEITKKMEANLRLESRFDNNFSRLDNYLAEVTVDHELARGFKIGGLYRFSKRNRTEFFSVNHRFSGFLAYSEKVDDRNTVGFRSLYQYQNEPVFEASERHYWRNRLELNHAFSDKWESGVQGEFWYDLFKKKNFHRFRGLISLQYEIVENNEIQLYQAFQQELSPVRERTGDIDFLTGVRYKISI